MGDSDTDSDSSYLSADEDEDDDDTKSQLVATGRVTGAKMKIKVESVQENVAEKSTKTVAEKSTKTVAERSTKTKKTAVKIEEKIVSAKEVAVGSTPTRIDISLKAKTEEMQKMVEIPRSEDAAISSRIYEIEKAILEKFTIKEMDETHENPQHVDLTANPNRPNTPPESPPKSPKGWGSWSSWGSSLVSTATASVATLSSQFGEGISTVLETMETAIGVPLPEEAAASAVAAQMNRSGEEIDDTDVSIIPDELSFVGRGFLSTVSTVGTIVEKTGTKVFQSSLDTLEMIGKKTMDVLQEGDPGLKNKRKFFGEDKLCLSDVLREAKEKAADTSTTPDQSGNSRYHYSTFFDEYQGLMHLEALEMVSKLNDAKLLSTLHQIGADVKAKVEPKIETIKHTCDLEELDEEVADDDEDAAKQIEEFKKLSNSISMEKLDEVYRRAKKLISTWPNERMSAVSSELKLEFHNDMIKILAEITARAVELLHKVATVILLPHDIPGQTIARNLANFSLSVHGKLNFFATKFSERMTDYNEDVESNDEYSTNSLITNIFLETSNSCSYIQDALHLVVPIIQLHVVTRAIMTTP